MGEQPISFKDFMHGKSDREVAAFTMDLKFGLGVTGNNYRTRPEWEDLYHTFRTKDRAARPLN